MSYLTLNNNDRSWSPFSELNHNMGKFFDDFWIVPPRGIRNLQEIDAQWIPACEVEEAENHYLISLEIAGVPKEQVKVEFHHNQIVVSGERQNTLKKIETGQRFSERRFGRFQRTFTLPAGIDPEKVEANHQDGMLRVYVPKAESAKPRQIKITNGNSTSSFKRLIGASSTKEEESKEGATFT